MATKIATCLASGNSVEATQQLVRRVREQLGEVEPALIMTFASSRQPLPEVVQELATAFPDTPMLGASTAGEFTEDRDGKGSVALFALAGDYRVFTGMGTNLRDAPEQAVEQALDGLPSELHGYPYRTALMLLDPLAGNAEEVTLVAAATLARDTRLAGGAAADDLKMASTEVACGRRTAHNAVAIAQVFSKAPLGVGVCHGHRPLSPPLAITRAEGNVVHTIERRPAFEVWKEHTRTIAAMDGIDVDHLNKDQEGIYLLKYEAGLAAGREYKIRAPLSRSDGSLNFACGIPEGSVIRITESNAELQVDSAREAARRARHQLGGAVPAGALVFDCICRKLILGDEFGRAIRGISHELGQVPLAGFETYGEIALDAGDLSGFHNTTSVVLAFPRA